ncbi:ABC transporter permease [Myxococcota bacterium]|nr:ABC transporter permease [Myxococcota bacterium]MBU1433104.1 ABC transporter permease [Myxococcota bacterium]MBU1900255.1 ABC transporter permease [Myxococcota bacterium]
MSQRLPYWLGGGLVLTFFVLAWLAPQLAPYPADHIDLVAALRPPSAAHWLGTDEDGADVLSQIIYGSRVAAQVGLGVVGLCALLGVSLGAISGYYGGLIDEILMRLIDVLMAFPGILLAILIIAITREPSISAVILALSLTGWAGYARLVRGQILSLKTRPFITAARAMGAPDYWILTRHLLPNVMAPVIVQATFGIASAILAEASLSFLGLGPSGAPSWGALLDQGARYFLISPHLAIAPGVAIGLVVLGVNLLGDALRDAYDPRRAEDTASR